MQKKSTKCSSKSSGRNKRNRKPKYSISILIVLAATAVFAGFIQSNSQTHMANRLDLDTISKHVSSYSDMPPSGEPETNEPAEALSHRQQREELHKNTYEIIQDPGKLLNGKQETIHFRIVDAMTIDDGSGDTDELPVHWSKAIVIATVTSAKAFLSKHRTYVYSDFQIKIDEILKQDSGQSLFVDESMVAERQGGTIHFPSGHITHYLIAKQGFPGVGKRYLFFLSRPNPNLPEYLITTAYEFRSGLVFPLDEGPFKQFEGMKAQDFTALVKTAIIQRGGR